MTVLYPGAALLAIALLCAGSYLQQRTKRRARRAQLRAQWGTPKVVDRDPVLVTSYHNALSQPAVDERTWKDLDFDAVFAFLDRTESVAGRQVLYHRLRSTTHSHASLAAFDGLVEALRQDEDRRLDIQLALRPLSSSSTNWVWSLAIEPIDALPRWAFVYPLFAVLGLVAGGALRAAFGRRLVPLAEPFGAMVRLLAVAKRLGQLEHLPPGVRERLTDRLPGLRRLQRSAGWLAGAHTGGADLGSFAIEYLNLLFCLDVNAAMMGLRELRRHQQDLHRVFQAVGELDSALSIASVRDGTAASLKPCAADGGALADGGNARAGWTRPHFVEDDQPAVLENVRHPLIENAVPNSVALGSPAGLLVTGSNMTGKSTFLRTVGVNAVLAQTIDTVFASSYRAPWLSVASCITPTDDLRSGKSYYQAEVETLVAMLSTRAPGRQLYLFDELFRGTNTLDRIAGASAVLAYLIRSPKSGVRGPTSLVVAATHDLELVSLLPDYMVVHFGDRLTPDGLQFDYILRAGPTTTRNAIALLGVLGAPPEVVSEALERAERLPLHPSGCL